MMMKRIFPGLVLFSLFIGSCVKNSDNKCSYTDSNVVAPASETDSLKNTLMASGITALQHSSGFFYKIDSSGTGMGITNLCSVVTVTYKGTFLNGQVFDSTATGNPAVFQLGQVIVAWQKGLPLINKGGYITLYIPPTLAYGSLGYGSIPGNAYLIFEIHIVDIE